NLCYGASHRDTFLFDAGPQSMTIHGEEDTTFNWLQTVAQPNQLSGIVDIGRIDDHAGKIIITDINILSAVFTIMKILLCINSLPEERTCFLRGILCHRFITPFLYQSIRIESMVILGTSTSMAFAKASIISSV